MTVSKDMVDISEAEYDGQFNKMRTPEQVAQAVINAAWTRFDPEDESTWPEKYGEYSVILRGEHDMDSWNGSWCFWKDGAIPTHYADPATLTPD